MSKRLKHHTTAELEHDLKSWGWAYDMDEISEKTHANITGKIKAELERREKHELKTLKAESHAEPHNI